jgi:type I restriction enzyme S subunit
MEEESVISKRILLDELPAHWRFVPLGTVADAKSGNGKLIKGKQHNEPALGRYPGYSASGQDIYCDVYEYDRDAIIISAVGARCGKCFLASGKWTAVANTHILLPDAKQIDNEYLWYMVNDESFWVKSGTAQPFVKVRKSLEIEIPVPPLPEQRRILAALETQLGRLDAAVARLLAAKAQLKRYKQAVLKAAFTDEDWPIKRLGDVYEVFVGSTPSRAKPQLWNGTVPWVSSGEVAFCEIHETRERIATEALGNSEKRLHPAGTVMLAMIGEGKTRGQAAILRIPAAHNQNTAAIRIPDEKHSPEYLYYYFLYEYENTRRVGSGNNQMALNKSRIQDMELPLPDADDQVRTALAIRDRFEVLAEMESTLDAQLLHSTRLRQSVLKRAFEGRLV